MAARITDIFPLLLITLLCVGAVEGGYQALEYFVLKPPADKAVVARTAPEKSGMPKQEDQKQKFDYRIILQRNLFGPPPGAIQPEETETPDITEDLKATSLNITLMGTVNGKEGGDRAIILDKSNNKQELYEKGDVIQGAMVKEILRGKVILTYNGKDEMLDMSEAEKERSAYSAPRRTVPGVNRTAPGFRPPVPPQSTPRRVINRPRTLPSRVIRKK